jgi:hypothetical protein
MTRRIEEKNEQIQLMKEVYNSVCLGELSWEISMVMDELHSNTTHAVN